MTGGTESGRDEDAWRWNSKKEEQVNLIFHLSIIIFLQTRLERKEALFKKKRARSALNKNVQSIDMGLYPQESVSNGLKPTQITVNTFQDSSDDDGLFTGTVWWESTDQVNC